MAVSVPFCATGKGNRATERESWVGGREPTTKQTNPKPNKSKQETRHTTELCLKMGVSLNHNLNLLSPDSYGYNSMQSGIT